MEEGRLCPWRFIQNFDIYTIASGKTEKLSEIKAAVLLDLVGEEAIFNICEFGKQAEEIVRNCMFLGVRDSALQ
ncbi:hypothetical protein PR048_014042 [Dryococelus australis]|uniref:Uncharacterized protein n=1 Tax=Dryococelus australis TaxID=614101 RepID=A0ABQ9HTW9_9NEOP|nr:hypothetical protein PR048_014042 [Dryococelus australis]